MLSNQSTLNTIKNKTVYFFITYAFFLMGVVYMVLFYSKTDGTILINQTWDKNQDVLFTYFTELGDGRTAIVVILGLLIFVSVRSSVIALSSFIFTAIITQFLKHLIFPNAMRPFIELWDEFKYGDLHLVLPEEIMKKGNSFPSGHTTSAFSVFIILTLFSKRPVWGVLFAFIAILASYSRVYLSQHFFEDILLGSLIGVFGSLLIYWLFISKDRLIKHDKSLLKLYKK